jgi:NAD(P)-dependent dehydrogenase (short-subunit alcohol dehydrogenase family)
VGEAAANRITAEMTDARIDFERLDLADLETVSAFARRMDRVDVLVNNAGVVMPPARQVTRDGFELHLGTNHLGHFALVAHLLPRLRKGEGPRVVIVSSLGHHLARINLEDLQFERRRYRKFAAYAQSKLANLLFMRELQRRSDAGGWGLTSVAAHPGFAATDALSHRAKKTWLDALEPHLRKLVPTAEQAARPVIYAAEAAEIQAGGYYGPSGPGEIAGFPAPARLSKAARTPELAARVWSVSETLTGIHFPTS